MSNQSYERGGCGFKGSGKYVHKELHYYILEKNQKDGGWKLEVGMDKEILKLIATKDNLKNLVTKKEFAEFRDENLTRLDEMMTILRRLDEERLFTL